MEIPWQPANRRRCQCQDCLRRNGISSGNAAAESPRLRSGTGAMRFWSRQQQDNRQAELRDTQAETTMAG